MLTLIFVPARVMSVSSLLASALWIVPFTTWYFRMLAKAVVSLLNASSVDFERAAKASFVGAKIVNSPERNSYTSVIQYIVI